MQLYILGTRVPVRCQAPELDFSMCYILHTNTWAVEPKEQSQVLTPVTHADKSLFLFFFLFWNLLFWSQECQAPASTFPPEIEWVLDFTELTRSAALHRSYPQWWHSSTFILGEDGEAHRSSMCVGGARCCWTAVQLALARAQLKHMVGTKGVHCASLGQKHVMFQFDLNSTFNSCSRAFDLFEEEWAAFHPQTIISKPSGPWGLNGVKTL